MAKFNVGDWVEVTPTPDTRWSEWTTEHSAFVSRIGQIVEIWPDWTHTDNRDEDWCKVQTYFADGTMATGPGWYFVSFKKRHLILTTPSNAQQYLFDEEAAAETNNYEAFVRAKRDQIFRYIFRDPYRDDIEEKIERFEDDMHNDDPAFKWMLLGQDP